MSHRQSITEEVSTEGSYEYSSEFDSESECISPIPTTRRITPRSHSRNTYRRRTPIRPSFTVNKQSKVVFRNTLWPPRLQKKMKPTKQDFVLQRVMSARRLKMNDLRNEIDQLNQQLLELKRENKLLKTLQARQEKALGRLEEREGDIPYILKQHMDDVRVLKLQLRKAHDKATSTETLLRCRDAEIDKLKRQLKKYELLVKNKKLEEREDLNKRLEKSALQLDEKIKMIQVLERKVELIGKKHHRDLGLEVSRHRSTQKILDETLDKYELLKQQFREKEKELEIKNIYSHRIMRAPHKLSQSSQEASTNTSRSGTSNSKNAPQVQTPRTEEEFIITTAPPVSEAVKQIMRKDILKEIKKGRTSQQKDVQSVTSSRQTDMNSLEETQAEEKIKQKENNEERINDFINSVEYSDSLKFDSPIKENEDKKTSNENYDWSERSSNTAKLTKQPTWSDSHNITSQASVILQSEKEDQKKKDLLNRLQEINKLQQNSQPSNLNQPAVERLHRGLPVSSKTLKNGKNNGKMISKPPLNKLTPDKKSEFLQELFGKSDSESIPNSPKSYYTSSMWEQPTITPSPHRTRSYHGISIHDTEDDTSVSPLLPRRSRQKNVLKPKYQPIGSINNDDDWEAEL